MEDTLFAVLLFVIINVFTALLFGDSTDTYVSEEKATETINITTQETTDSEAPIEQQCKEVFKDILTPESTPERVSLSEREIEELTLREARKVIAALNKGLKRNDARRIRLKVNGKDQPKSWLISQIKSKLQQPETEKTIVSVIAALRNAA